MSSLHVDIIQKILKTHGKKIVGKESLGVHGETFYLNKW